MGVPKFFRYISERYPCLSELVKEYQIPEFDNLYLDMNGIIHMCSHPDDNDPHFRITEETIFRDIFHYIEVLFCMIKPQQVFFMAIDGVAPRAKMNQQRGRRFRTAKDAEKMEKKAKDKGEVLPDQSRFDSNCITPGTVFMAKLHEQLKFFIVNKISNDQMWQNCRIILSGHETPGEGEHKIMDYIRYLRAQPGYDPNTRHCLYGLDADLVMLGLCTHDPHFSLLREEVKFGKKGQNAKRKNVPEQITFYLLHLSLMREYLEQEFIQLKDQLSFGYNIENIIDDWVLMGFLVGNDFIPHLPNLHIANGALPLLYRAYIKVMPTFDGYINEAGTLNLERFEKFMDALCSIDIDHFTEQYADLKYFESKTGRRPNEKERTSYKPRKLEQWQADADDADDSSLGALEEPIPTKKPDLAALIKATENMFLDSSASALEEDSDTELDFESESIEDEDDLFDAEFRQHKKDYYMNKLEYIQVTPEVLRSQAECYVRAIQWNLNYYYNGVCSWSWFYPHHYAPFISDIKNFKDFKIEFDLGTPFKPYEQLLAVLPTASKILLPEPYHRLMESDDSPIKDYFPTEFGTDLNGKRQEWEAVVLIPFIDENRLLAAMAPCNEQLSEEEKRRNTHGPLWICEYTTKDFGEYEAPEYFPPVKHNHTLVLKVTNEDLRIPPEKLVKGAYPNTLFDVYYPGFPTLKHLRYTSYIKKGNVKVFDQPSRNENVILQVLPPKPVPADTAGRNLLGSVVFVSWPHLVEAMVVTIATIDYRYHVAQIPGEYNVEANKGNLAQNWQTEKGTIESWYRDRMGIDVGDTTVLVYVKMMVGRRYIFTPQGRVSIEKEWADTLNVFPLQIIVENIASYSPSLKAYHNIEDVFAVNTKCFMMGLPHYGFMGTVLDSSDALKKGRVKIALAVTNEPNFTNVFKLDSRLSASYLPVHVAANMLNISRHLFSRITGGIFVIMGPKREGISEDMPKQNIGLDLKFNKRSEEIPGYTKKANAWLYSEKAVELVREYMDAYPGLFLYLEGHGGNDYFYEYDLFPLDKGSGETVKKIIAWIREQPPFTTERQQWGSKTLEPDVVKDLEKTIETFTNGGCTSQTYMMQVKPHLLYKPGLVTGSIPPDTNATYRLFDRVVNVRESHTVPLGHVGTIIAIHNTLSGKPEDIMYDVLFDTPFTGGIALNCSPQRGYRMSRLALVNRSHGLREMEKKAGKPGQLLQQIGYKPKVFGTQQFQQYQTSRQQDNINKNSAFAPWGIQQEPEPSLFQKKPPKLVQTSHESNASTTSNGNQADQKDFMPSFNKETTKNPDRSTTKSKKADLKRSIKSNVNQKPDAQPNKSSNSSIGLSVSANDLIAHVSAQMQKMNMTAPQIGGVVPPQVAFPIAPMPAPALNRYALTLLGEFQRRGLGCPVYAYIHDARTNTHQAQLKVPFTNETVVSKPLPTKDEASENAAELLLKKLMEPLPPVMPPMMVPMQFPTPPMQWCMPSQAPSTTSPMPPNLKQPLQQMQQNQFQQHLQNLQKSFAEQSAVQGTPMMKPDALLPKQQKCAVPFVPLQAVKQQRIHKNSTSNTQQTTNKKGTPHSQGKEHKRGTGGGEANNAGSQAQGAAHQKGAENKSTGKPRRERKIRLAAKFPATPQ